VRLSGGRDERRGGVGGIRTEGVVDDSRSSDDVVIGDQGRVLLARDGEVSGSLSLGEVDGTVGTDGVGGDDQSLVEDGVLAGTGQSLEGDLAVSVGESREGSEGESGVGGGARSGVDEGGSDAVDGGEGDGGVVRTRPGLLHVDSGADPGLVSGLGGEDGSGNGNVGLLHDGRSGTQVGCGEEDVVSSCTV
jgi:hypothetical protein